MKTLIRITVVFCLVVLQACVVTPRGTSGSVIIKDENVQVAVVFSDKEKTLIRKYYDTGMRGKKHKKLPPGLAKKQQLPPGLRKQLVKNGKLPPGLEGRRLPAELHKQLRKLPDNYVRLQVGTDIVLMDRNTKVIFDVMLNVVL